MPRAFQPSFAAGELSPALHGRVDLAKYAVGAAMLKNWVVRKEGGISTRGGTELVDAVAERVGGVEGYDGYVRLIPFQFSITQTYVLEFTDNCMRVIKDGDFVLNPLVDVTRYKWTASGVAGEYYLEAAAGGQPDIRRPGSTEVFFDGTEVSAGTIGSLGVGEWAWGNNDALAFNTLYVRVAGSVDPDTLAAGYVSVIYRMYTGFEGIHLSDIRFTQSADTIFFAHPRYNPQTLTRSNHYVWTLAAVVVARSLSAPTISSVVADPAPATAVVYNPYYFVTSIDDAGEETALSTGVSASVDRPWAAGQIVTVTWGAVTGAVRYNVYKRIDVGNTVGLIGTSESTSFVDDNIEPDTLNGAPSTSAIVGTDPGWDSDRSPGVVGLFEQRAIYARTDSQPQAVFGSQTGIFDNFFTSYPLRDSDAFEATINTQQVNEIRHLVPLRDIFIFTAGAEWVFTHGDNTDALTPTSLAFKVQSYYGCSNVPPLVVGSAVLFITRSGNVVREFAYSLQNDGFTGSDLSVLAHHLFRGKTIVSWAYQRTPDSIIWVVLDDGTLLGFTFLKDNEVWAWHQHNTDGLFQDVTVIASDDEDDEVYFAVKRVINSETKVFVETLKDRMSDDTIESAWCVDCGLQYDGAAATVISGLGHLEGESVAVLADGNVVAGMTVSGGSITLPHEAEVVTVGLPYVCDFQSLAIDVSDEQGSTLTRERSVTSVVVKFDKSRAVFIGQSEDNLLEFKWRENEDWDTPTALFTGDKHITIEPEWGRKGQIFVRQSNPVPTTILSIAPEIEASDW